VGSNIFHYRNEKQKLSFILFLKFFIMKKVFLFFVMIAFLCSCGVFGGSSKTGCPTNGRNVGAEKLLSGDAKTTKEVKKAPKFKY
jgi:hypothetical protein